MGKFLSLITHNFFVFRVTASSRFLFTLHRAMPAACWPVTATVACRLQRRVATRASRTPPLVAAASPAHAARLLLRARRAHRSTAAAEPPSSPPLSSERSADAGAKAASAAPPPGGGKEHYMTFEEEQFVFGYEPSPGEGPPAGPPALLLAGLRAEEAPKVRQLLDELGGHEVKVVLLGDEVVRSQTLAGALRTPEPDWGAPRPGTTPAGGGAGAPRVLLFSGLDSGERSVVVSALEARGLPRLAVASVTVANMSQPVGAVLAAAVETDRDWAARVAALKAGRPLPKPRAKMSPQEAAEEAEEEAQALRDAGGDEAGFPSFPKKKGTKEGGEGKATAQPQPQPPQPPPQPPQPRRRPPPAATVAGPQPPPPPPQPKPPIVSSSSSSSAAAATAAAAASAASSNAQSDPWHTDEPSAPPGEAGATGATGGDAGGGGGGGDEAPAWMAEFEALMAEVERRGAAGEDLSFMRDPSAPPPAWAEDVLGGGALAAAFAESAAAIRGEGRKDLMDFDAELGEEGYNDDDDEEEGGVSSKGYATKEELMEALTRAKGADAAKKETIFGPDE